MLRIYVTPDLSDSPLRVTKRICTATVAFGTRRPLMIQRLEQSARARALARIRRASLREKRETAVMDRESRSAKSTIKQGIALTISFFRFPAALILILHFQFTARLHRARARDKQF